MKKFIIIMMIIASFFIIAGIGMIVVSSAFSLWPWSENFCDEMRKIYYNGKMVQKTVEASPEALKIIDINMINENIEVVKGNDKAVITYWENSINSYELIQTKDKIILKEEIKSNFWPFKYRLRNRNNQNTLLIQLPDKTKLDKLDISIVNGKVVSGPVKIKNVNLNLTNGTIKLVNCQFDQLKAYNTNGICEAKGCTVKKLDLRTVNGSLSVNKGDVIDMNLNAVNGKIELNDLPGKSSDYSINCKTVHGNVYINNVKVVRRGAYKSGSSGNRIINAETVNGKIEINTLYK
jgi:hypothetical protein